MSPGSASRRIIFSILVDPRPKQEGVQKSRGRSPMGVGRAQNSRFRSTMHVRGVSSVWESAGFASRRSPVRSRYAPFTDRSPLGFAEHDDFDRFHLSIRCVCGRRRQSRRRRTMATPECVGPPRYEWLVLRVEKFRPLPTKIRLASRANEDSGRFALWTVDRVVPALTSTQLATFDELRVWLLG
jgi:hypothetical protein